MSVQLVRPDPPFVEERVAWPGLVLAVFGRGDVVFAEAFAEVRGARLVRSALRHAAGFTWDGLTLTSHPDSLVEALCEARAQAPVTIGVGGAFAVGVRSTMTIWIRDGAPALALPRSLRVVAAGAQLVLEEPRVAVARELALRL